ncbi:hypothetical protein kac65v162_gp039 [Nodularia phage vB_NspS-kac65v162]|jgi:hypothetical protein|uniref:Uncharacterized protein n=1 Tax=Nodularia phage vB_NspS-kac65v162 TaxID=2557581 RepID=A0A482MKB0_9CAUD|nr:hypothetical protein kac65v162_gp039 [Nodularia phage vB_NspS-kac65v162]
MSTSISYNPSSGFNGRINGVELIYQTDKPITRPDESPLEIGDRWYNPNTGIEGFWNGTYWLRRPQPISISSGATITNTSGFTYAGGFPVNHNSSRVSPMPILNGLCNPYLVSKVIAMVYTDSAPSTWDDQNFWRMGIRAGGTPADFGHDLVSIDFDSFTFASTALNASATPYLAEITPNIVFNDHNKPNLDITLVFTKIGLPSNLSHFFVTLFYSLVL